LHPNFLIKQLYFTCARCAVHGGARGAVYGGA
jgi:hypothetical protein